MENQFTQHEIEALELDVSKLNTCIQGIQHELIGLYKILNDIQSNQSTSLPEFIDNNTPTTTTGELQKSEEEPVIFKWYDDGTPKGLILPLVIGRDSEGNPVYF